MGYSIGTPPSPVPGSRGQGTGTALNVSALIKPQMSDPEPTAGSPPQRGRATSQYFAIKRSQVPRGLLPEGVMLVMPHRNGGVWGDLKQGPDPAELQESRGTQQEANLDRDPPQAFGPAFAAI